MMSSVDCSKINTLCGPSSRCITFTCHNKERTNNNKMLLLIAMCETIVPTGDNINEEEFKNETNKEQSPLTYE